MTPSPDPTTASDQELVARARQGREDGYRELVHRYQRPVHSLIYRMVRDREVANDLVQETFIKAFKALETYRTEFKFSSWILKIANNTAINHLKRRRLHTLPLETSPCDASPRNMTATALQLAAVSSSTPARVDARARARALAQAIGRLKGKYRRCFTLRYIEEQSYDHIAETLDLPVGTVKSCVHRARNQVKDMLAALATPSDAIA